MKNQGKNMLNTTLKYFICLILICAGFYFSGIILWLISSLFIIFACKEYRNIFKNKNIEIYKIFPEIICIIFALFFIVPSNSSDKTNIFMLIVALFTSYAITIIKNQKPYIETANNTFMLIFYIFCGLFVIKIYETQTTQTVATYFCCVLLSDYFASVTGKKIKKRHQLAQEISPNKTYAGFFTHLITSIGIFTAASSLIGLTYSQGVIFGFLISGAAQIGDLTISCIKRDCGIKHSGKLFGEYGGILDRLDAFIFSAPITYMLLTIFYP